MTKLSQKFIDDILSRYLIGDPNGYSHPFDAWSGESQVAPVVRAFRSNLESAINVGSVPFRLTDAAVRQRHFDRVFSAERIRQLNNEASDEERNNRALEIARQRFAEELEKPEVQEAVQDEILRSLNFALGDRNFNPASDELLRQVTVMVWGAFEVLATDTAIAVLNRVPELAADVMEEQSFKRMGLPRGIPIETLKAFSFNVSESMGAVLFGEGRLDSFPAIAAVCRTLYKSAELDTRLKTSRLWKLAQRRNLIVHRRGVVDKQYLEKTSDTQPIDSKLVVLSGDIDGDLLEVRDIGLLIGTLASQVIASA